MKKNKEKVELQEAISQQGPGAGSCRLKAINWDV